MFCLHVQEPVHIGFGGQKLPHFFTGTPVLSVGFLLFLQQLCILGLQVFDLGQLLHTHLVKGIFGCLMEQDFFLMFLPEFSGITGLAVCHIGLTGLGIVDDMGTQDSDLRHAFLRRLDLHRQFVVVGGGRRRFFCQFRIIQQPMFGEKIYSLRHLFQVKNLGPAHIPSTFSSLQFCLNVHQ